jgi:hypothetical protein
MTGLLGWAFGGFLFGILADYIGRVRTLAFSIALYSVFTALQGLSLGIFDFAIYRFIAGLGTGAELMVGIPLLAETLAETHRAKIDDDRWCSRHFHRRLGLRPRRPVWLALRVLCRRRAGDYFGDHARPNAGPGTLRRCPRAAPRRRRGVAQRSR